MTIPASAQTSAAPRRMPETTSSGSVAAGTARTLSANAGVAPIAYKSLSELAAAMAPKSSGSSTIGVKKSTLATSTRPSPSSYTAASSGVSSPTSKFSSSVAGSTARIFSRSSGPSLQAQPAPCEYWVSRTRSDAGVFMVGKLGGR